jgi:hypothetical protein
LTPAHGRAPFQVVDALVERVEALQSCAVVGVALQ